MNGAIILYEPKFGIYLMMEVQSCKTWIFKAGTHKIRVEDSEPCEAERSNTVSVDGLRGAPEA
jgi:hypothetical protein